MAENYEPLAPAGGAPLPPPPVAAAAPMAQGPPQSPAAGPIQSTPAQPGGNNPVPPLLPPKKPANQLPLARKNQKPKSRQKHQSSVSFAPAALGGGDDKISENVSSVYGNDEENGEERNSGQYGAGGNYEESISTVKTTRNNVRFYCMITSGIMGGFFALAAIGTGIFAFVRQ